MEDSIEQEWTGGASDSKANGKEKSSSDKESDDDDRFVSGLIRCYIPLYVNKKTFN